MTIHAGKIIHEPAPNGLKVVFSNNKRLGVNEIIPPFNKQAPNSTITLYDLSFARGAEML